MNPLSLIDPIDQLLPDMFRRFSRPMRTGENMPADIRLDVVEHDKEYQVRAEIPGAKKEDIHVNVDGNFVSISAEVRKETEEKSGGRVLLKETYLGSASRGFSLAHDIDSKGVTAKFEDGVLKLTLPKLEGSASRAITIQ
ncbi:MAG: Hsp20 family protein [Burkholderiales bacterium]|nr:Hsp20 family protein [Burkholderiales bacterium]